MLIFPETSGDAFKNHVENRYIAFCDILGFSDKVLTDFDGTISIYKDFSVGISELHTEDVQITIYSDSILITSIFLDKVLNAAQVLWFIALSSNLMIRGAITQGKYWEHREGNHFLVASDALIRAVKLEKSIGIPAVVVADDIEIPDHFWLRRFKEGPLGTSLLHFRDRNIVNPFNTFWGRSAGTRVTQLMAENPKYKDKYLWFLALHRAVGEDDALIPSDVLLRFVQQGIIKPRTIISTDHGDMSNV